jgi:mannose/fructose/N-acetylgalactosamine-specific phosphotransferase system component IIC
MEGFRLGWRLAVAIICLVVAACGIYENIKQGIPDNATSGYAVGLYTPAALLIAVGIALIMSDSRRRNA